MTGFRTFLSAVSLSMALVPIATQSVASQHKAPKIIFYAKDDWDGWAVPPVVSLDRIKPPITINGKRYERCAELAKDLEGEPMTYQFQVDHPYLYCVANVLYGNIQRPKSALFPERGIAQDVFKNLDLDGIPWDFQYKEGVFHSISNILNLKNTIIQ